MNNDITCKEIIIYIGYLKILISHSNDVMLYLCKKFKARQLNDLRSC